MDETGIAETIVPGVPEVPADAENEALIDAEKTFKITVVASILFGLAALFIIMRTRMG